MKIPSHSVFLKSSGATIAAAMVAVLSAGPVLAAAALPVAVTNVPSVNAHLTNPSVTVSNTSSAPLFVQTESTARAGMGSGCFDSDPASTGTLKCQLSSIPAGQILVIETISCVVGVVTGTPFASLVLAVGAPNPNIPGSTRAPLNHWLSMTRTPSLDHNDLSYYGLITPVRIYAFGDTLASGGDTPVFVFGTDGTAPPTSIAPNLDCALSGHFESQ